MGPRRNAYRRQCVCFDNKGDPNFIAYAQLDQNGQKIIQGKYGIDGNKPENKGRLIYSQAIPNQSMPYYVVSKTTVYTYYCKYLELTTVGDNNNGYNAYVIKAIVFNNKIDAISNENYLEFSIPDGVQLTIVDGKIKIGEKYITPTYGLSGKFH